MTVVSFLNDGKLLRRKWKAYQGREFFHYNHVFIFNYHFEIENNNYFNLTFQANSEVKDSFRWLR